MVFGVGAGVECRCSPSVVTVNTVEERGHRLQVGLHLLRLLGDLGLGLGQCVWMTAVTLRHT